MGLKEIRNGTQGDKEWDSRRLGMDSRRLGMGLKEIRNGTQGD